MTDKTPATGRRNPALQAVFDRHPAATDAESPDHDSDCPLYDHPNDKTAPACTCAEPPAEPREPRTVAGRRLFPGLNPVQEFAPATLSDILAIEAEAIDSTEKRSPESDIPDGQPCPTCGPQGHGRHEDDSYGSCVRCYTYVPHSDVAYERVAWPCPTERLREAAERVRDEHDTFCNCPGDGTDPDCYWPAIVAVLAILEHGDGAVSQANLETWDAPQADG